jgi:hypothetical protein
VNGLIEKYFPVYVAAYTEETATFPALSLSGNGNVTGNAEFFVLTAKRDLSKDQWVMLLIPQDALNGLHKLPRRSLPCHRGVL